MSTDEQRLKIDAEVTLRQAEEAEEEPAEGEDPPVPEVVSEQVAQAYYPAAIAAADHARTRSQAAYTIASAVAATLVAAGLFGGFDDKSAAVQAAGLFALGAWLTAAYFFMRAVSESRPALQRAQGVKNHASAFAFVKSRLEQADRERRLVEKQQQSAVEATLVALVFTFFTIGGVLIDDPDDPSRRGSFTFFQAGRQAVDDSCTATVTTLEGSVDPSKLDDEFVPVKVDAGACREGKTTLQLRKKHIAAVALSD